MSKTSSWLVTYLPTLRTFVHRLRATSSSPSSLSSTILSSKAPQIMDNQHILQDYTTLTQVDNQPLKMPVGIAQLGLQPGLTLPGATGVAESMVIPQDKGPCESEGLSGCVSSSPPTAGDSSIADDAIRTVECKLQECPEFIHDEMMQLFPEIEIARGDLRLIILTEKTHCDMTTWSPAVEEEREELLAHFIDSAKEVCSRLMAAGYWSDFIDPASGRAFYGCHTQSTLFETDDKFRYLGFEIQDLGCCKCIMHPLWGSYTFVGTIFTNSPITSPAIQEIINL